jgi:hypothetical protein
VATIIAGDVLPAPITLLVQTWEETGPNAKLEEVDTINNSNAANVWRMNEVNIFSVLKGL